MFSGRLPEEMTYETSGANDIYYFEAVQYEYTVQIDDDDEDEEDVIDWKDSLEDLVDDFNDTTNVIKVHMFSLDRLGKDLAEAVTLDFALYIGMLLFIFLYGFFILGRCHPVFCRVPLTLALILQYGMTLCAALGFTCFIYPFVASNVYITYILAL
mmetsp:Transcript_10141/g.1505  ORF Transcript_10141/g.1505 Transcript_10141/m.1505 type:complete len:156 (+) Transcript_10141:588-1055(+)